MRKSWLETDVIFVEFSNERSHYFSLSTPTGYLLSFVLLLPLFAAQWNKIEKNIPNLLGKKNSECFQISLVPFWYAWTKFVQVFRIWLHSEWYMWMLQTIWFSRSHRKSSFRAKPLYFGLFKFFWPIFILKKCLS